MKKLLLMAALAVTSLSATAQVSIIPKAGITISNVAFDDDNDYDGQESLLGFTGGLGFNYALTSDDFFSIQPEILYTQKGWAVESSSSLGSYSGTYRLNYLEVPLLLKINFGGETIKAYVNAGPSVGYLLSGRVKGNWNALGIVGGDINQTLEFTDNPDPLTLNELDANRVEVGLNFGGGVGYGFGDNVLFADVRYNMGLTDFNNDFTSKNRVFAITAGVQIAMK